MLITTLALATCFELVGPKYHYLPKELCYSDMKINIEQSLVSIESDSMPDTMTTELVRHNEDYYSFKASKKLFEKTGSSCSYEAVGFLNLKGKVNNYGEIDTLDMWIDYQSTNDYCHSPMRPGKAVYQLKK